MLLSSWPWDFTLTFTTSFEPFATCITLDEMAVATLRASFASSAAAAAAAASFSVAKIIVKLINYGILLLFIITYF